MAHGNFGLVPCDENLSGVKCDLTQLDVDISTQGFLVETKVELRYTLTTTDDDRATMKFVYPYRINDVNLIIFDVSTRISRRGDNDRIIKTEVRDQHQTSMDVIKLPQQPQGGMCLNINQDCYQCAVGEIITESTAIVTLQYVSSLGTESEGKPVYMFPNLLAGRTDQTEACMNVRLVLPGFAKHADVESSLGSILVPSNSNNTVVATLNTTDTYFDIKGRVWYSYENGDLRVQYETHQTPEGETSRRLGISVNAPSSSGSSGYAASVTNDIDVVFIIDRSGSMRSGGRIEHAKETLLLFLKSLPVGCHFNIVGFGSTHEFLFNGGNVEYTADTLKTAIEHQEKICADLGCTNLYTPLEKVLGEKVRKGCSRIVLVLTDGNTDNNSACVKLAKSNAQGTRIYPFGIGSGVSRSFIEDLGKATGGHYEFTTTDDRDMETKVMKTLQIAMSVNTYRLTWNVDVQKGLVVDTSQLLQNLMPGERREFFLNVTGEPAKGKSRPNAKVKVVMENENGTNPFTYFSQPQPSVVVHRALAVQDVQRFAQAQRCNPGQLPAYQANQIGQMLKPHNVASPFVAVVSSIHSPNGDVRPLEMGYSNIQTGGSAPGVISTTGFGTAPVTTTVTPIRANARKIRTNIFRGNLNGITKSALKRIAARGGVARMTCLVHDEMRAALKEFMTKIIKDAVLYTDHDRRKRVSQEDMDKALKNNGVKLYGIEEYAPAIFEGDGTKRKATRRFYQRTTPLGRPEATTSSVASLFGVTRNDVQTGMARPSITKRKSSSIRTTSSGKGKLSKQPTLILSDSDQPDSNTRSKSRQASITRTSITNKSACIASRTSSLSVSHSVQSSRAGTKRKGRSTDTPPAKVSRSDTADKTSSTGKGASKGNVKGKAVARKQRAGARNLPMKPVQSRTRSAASSRASTGAPDFQAMIGLITMQQFDGHWSLSADLAKLFQKPLAALRISPVTNDEVWATALAVTWLEQTFPGQRMEWEMIHYKAIKFMEGHDLQGHTVTDIQQKAADALK